MRFCGFAARQLPALTPLRRRLVEVPVGRCWLNAPLSPRRAIAWVTLPLADLREIGHAHDATVNDVLLAVLAGALRRYAEPRDLLPEQPLAAGVPVALPNEEGRDNAVTAIVVGLATDEADPAARPTKPIRPRDCSRSAMPCGGRGFAAAARWVKI